MDWNYIINTDLTNKIKQSIVTSIFILLFKNTISKKISSLQYSTFSSSSPKLSFYNKFLLKQYNLFKSLHDNCWRTSQCIVYIKPNSRIVFSVFLINTTFLIIDKISSASNRNTNRYKSEIIDIIKGCVFGWVIFGRLFFIINSAILSLGLGIYEKYISEYFVRVNMIRYEKFI